MNTEGFIGPGDNLLTVEELAAELHIKRSTFYSWRSQDRGPRSFRLGNRVVYSRRDVVAWLEAEKTRTARGGAE